jgi:hypothetical protein
MIFSFGSGSGFPSMKVNFHCNKEKKEFKMLTKKELST